MAKKDSKAKVEAAAAEPSTTKKSTTKATAPTKSAAKDLPPLGNKDYDKALKKLHVELVKLQEWVVHKGLKVCIVFEGRDDAKDARTGALGERLDRAALAGAD